MGSNVFFISATMQQQTGIFLIQAFDGAFFPLSIIIIVYFIEPKLLRP